MAARKYKKKTKTRWGYKVLALLFFIIAISLTVIVFQYRKVKLVYYESFGTYIPVNYKVHGIDVSKYQEKIDWERVKNMRVNGIHISFAFIRVAHGTKRPDGYFKKNWERCRKAGLTRGAYLYLDLKENIDAQVSGFIKKVTLRPGDLPPVIDLEHPSGLSKKVIKEKLKAALIKLEKHYGVRPILYTYVSFYNKYLGNDFDDYPLWIAHYNTSFQRPLILRSWSIWQYSEHGKVDGIKHKVDLNVFNGEPEDFEKLKIPEF